ncbi:MAG: 30S ribosomal protein S7 [Patescibacteria group bacterium]
MARGNAKIKKPTIAPDSKFGSLLLAKFINHIMFNGKKSVAERSVYSALTKAAAELHVEPLDIFQQALKNVGPILEVKSKRIGGANYQVPMEVNKDRRNTLAMRWIIGAARSKKGQAIAEKLSRELIDAYRNEGAAIKKREETHRMAEANKAFAHFARF